MSDSVKSFQEERIAKAKLLLNDAEIHNATHTVQFAVPEGYFPEGITAQSLDHHMAFVNNATADVATAMIDIAADQERFNETKSEKWDGLLKLGDNLSISSLVQLRDVVGDEPTYGHIETLVDHTYGEDLTGYMTDIQSDLASKAAKLFS